MLAACCQTQKLETVWSTHVKMGHSVDSNRGHSCYSASDDEQDDDAEIPISLSGSEDQQKSSPGLYQTEMLKKRDIGDKSKDQDKDDDDDANEEEEEDEEGEEEEEEEAAEEGYLEGYSEQYSESTLGEPWSIIGIGL